MSKNISSIIQVFGLLLTVFVALRVGDTRPEMIILFILAYLIYFLPTMVAGHRNQQPTTVGVINLFLGWTLVGWVVALAIAVSDKGKNVISKNKTLMKRCSHCAEEIQPMAKLCRYCGNTQVEEPRTPFAGDNP